MTNVGPLSTLTERVAVWRVIVTDTVCFTLTISSHQQRICHVTCTLGSVIVYPARRSTPVKDVMGVPVNNGWEILAIDPLVYPVIVTLRALRALTVISTRASVTVTLR